MYEQHWSLQSKPFDNRTDPDFYFASESHETALLKLHYAIETRRSVAVVCGDAGVGKTMLLDTCFSQLPEFIAPTVRVVYPAMPGEQLLRYIRRQIAPQETSTSGQFGPIGNDVVESIETIERVLRHNGADGNHAVVAIDEAHLLESFGTIETLRLLLNLANEPRNAESALTLVLCGSPNLIAHLSRHTSLEDRIAVRCVIERFGLEDTTRYIRHRLKAAGNASPTIFDRSAIEMVQHLASGVPRRINRLCDLALMIGFAQERKFIDAATIESAHAELSTSSMAA